MSKPPAPQTGKNLYQAIHDEFEYQIRTALARGKSARELDNADTVAAIELATKKIMLEVEARRPVAQVAA